MKLPTSVSPGDLDREPDELQTYCKPLFGHRLISVERMDRTWFFKFSGDITAATESLWRLLDNDRIVVTAEDHDRHFARPEGLDVAGIVLASTAGRRLFTFQDESP